MKAINGKKKQSRNKLQRRRQALLAMVHIALKDLGMPDEDYRGILLEEFCVSSAAALSLSELGDLVDRFREKGWQPEGGRQRKEGSDMAEIRQARALRERAETLAGEIENGERRLKGLCKKICGVDKLEWCRDVGKLRRLLKVLGNIARG